MYKNQILNIYPIYNIIQIDKLYENYLRNFLNDKHWNHYSKSYIDSKQKYFFEYTNYIKN